MALENAHNWGQRAHGGGLVEGLMTGGVRHRSRGTSFRSRWPIEADCDAAVGNCTNLCGLNEAGHGGLEHGRADGGCAA